MGECHRSLTMSDVHGIYFRGQIQNRRDPLPYRASLSSVPLLECARASVAKRMVDHPYVDGQVCHVERVDVGFCVEIFTYGLHVGLTYRTRLACSGRWRGKDAVEDLRCFCAEVAVRVDAPFQVGGFEMLDGPIFASEAVDDFSP